MSAHCLNAPTKCFIRTMFRPQVGLLQVVLIKHFVGVFKQCVDILLTQQFNFFCPAPVEKLRSVPFLFFFLIIIIIIHFNAYICAVKDQSLKIGPLI